MSNSSFIVDRKLTGIKLNRLLEVRGILRKKGTINLPPTDSTDRPIIDNSGGNRNVDNLVLIPDKLYPSENPSLKFYLPKYKISLDDDGRPEIELRYAEQSSGEMGRLTLDLTWTKTRGRGVHVRVMEHITDLSLSFRVPVQSQNASSSESSAAENIIQLQPLQQLGDFKAQSTTLFYDKAQFDAVYQAMRDPKRKPVLELKVTAKVGIRTWRQIIVGKANEKDQVNALVKRKALFTNMLSVRKINTAILTPNTSSIRVRNTPPKPEEKLHIAATRAMIFQPAAVAHFAQPATRPATNTRVGQPVPATRMTASPAMMRAINTASTTNKKPMMTGQPPAFISPVMFRAMPIPATTGPATVKADRRRAPPATVKARRPRARPATVKARRPRTARTGANPRTASAMMASSRISRAAFTPANTNFKPQISAEVISKVYTPKKMTMALNKSDLKIKGRIAIPSFLPMDVSNKPAIFDAELDDQQSIPFAFPVSPAHPKNSKIYVLEGFTSSIHLLLPITLQDSNDPVNPRTYIVYQDNLMPDVIHVAPTEFRMLRDLNSPFLPAMLFQPSEFATADNDEETEVLFRMSVVYKLEPWLDPNMMKLAREQLQKEGLVARFTPIVPRDASLTLDLDILGDEQKRDSLTINPSTAITDSFELDHEDFIHLWQSKLGVAASGGISGRVDYHLFDGTPASSKVRISFWEDSSELFDVNFIGPVPDKPGHYHIVLRNRIESPVTVINLTSYTVAPGVVAHPVNETEFIGKTLQSQEAINIEYLLQPSNHVVESLEPVVIGRAKPDLGILLKRMLDNQGYRSLSFSVTIEALEDSFKTLDTDTGPLTGLLVEFDDGTRATLSAGDEQTEVTLVGRLIGQILGTADDQQRYFYRVTNLHPAGEGARTGWFDGQGSEQTLVVGPAVVDLDF